jgi:hypothetical protein
MFYVYSCLYHLQKNTKNQKEWHVATKRKKNYEAKRKLMANPRQIIATWYSVLQVCRKFLLSTERTKNTNVSSETSKIT